MSSEDFHEYWEKVHADFALSLPGFKQIAKRYTQFHTIPQYQEKAAILGLPILDFDGTAEMWVESVEDYAKHMNQKDIVEAVMKDGANFMGGGAHVMIGYETLVLGEPVPGLPKDKNFRL